MREEDAALVNGEQPSGGMSLRSLKKAKSRHAIERAMLELVVERGFENVTVEDVCQRAEVSKKTFFNYFPSKDAAIRGWFGDIPAVDDFKAALEAEQGDSYLECLVSLAQSNMAEGFCDAGLRRLRREVFSRSPQLLFRGHKDIAEVQANMSAALKAHLQDHPECRMLPDEPLTVELLVASSAVASLMRIRLVSSVHEDEVMIPYAARKLLACMVGKGL